MLLIYLDANLNLKKANGFYFPWCFYFSLTYKILVLPGSQTTNISVFSRSQYSVFLVGRSCRWEGTCAGVVGQRTESCFLRSVRGEPRQSRGARGPACSRRSDGRRGSSSLWLLALQSLFSAATGACGWERGAEGGRAVLFRVGCQRGGGGRLCQRTRRKGKTGGGQQNHLWHPGSPPAPRSWPGSEGGVAEWWWSTCWSHILQPENKKIDRLKCLFWI